MGGSRGKSKTKSLKESASSQSEVAEKEETANEVLNNTDSANKRACKKSTEVGSGVEFNETLPVEELETRTRNTRGRKSVQGKNDDEKPKTRKSGRKTNQINSYKVEGIDNDEVTEDKDGENSNDFASSEKKRGQQLKNDKTEKGEKKENGNEINSNENGDSQSVNKSHQSRSKSKSVTQKQDENDNDDQETRKKRDEHESGGASKKSLKRKAKSTTAKSSNSTKQDSANEESDKSSTSKKPKKSASSKDPKKSQTLTKNSKTNDKQQENKPKKDEDDNNDDDDDDDDSSSNASSKEYEVEKLVDIITKKNGKREFLVRWKGYTSKDDTWEPERHLNCKHLIDQFLKKNENITREMRPNRKVTDRYVLYHPGKKLSSRLNRKPRKTYYGTD